MEKWQISLEESKLKILFYSIGLDPAILIITVIKTDKTHLLNSQSTCSQRDSNVWH